MKKLKYLLLIFIIFITPNVFAQDFTVSNTNITSPNSGGSGKYTGTEIYNTGTSNVYNMNTRYNGKLSRIVFNLSPGGYAETTSHFDLGKTYTLTLNMSTDDWRNNFGSVSVKCDGSSGTELSNGRVNYISYRKINFSFSTGSNNCGFVYVDLKSKNISSTAFTGVSNWNLSSMVITDPTYCSGSDCYSPPSGGSSGSTNQDIINSNNQNTQDIITNDDKNTNNIINNNTNNTNNIIENSNENTNKLIDEIKNGSVVCGYNYKEVFKFQDMPNNGYLGSTGAVNSSSNFKFSDYTPIFGGYSYNVSGWSFGSSSYYYLIVYDQNKNFLFSFNYAENTNLDLSNYSGLLFIRINVNTNTGNNVMIVQNDGICVPSSYVQMKQNEDINNSINDTNNYLKDDSNPYISDDEFTSLLDSVNINNPLSSLLELPVKFVNVLINQSNTCQVVNLGTLLGVPITLPCIDIGSILGSSIWNTIDILSSIGLITLILKQLYESITNALTLGGYMDAKKYGLGYMSPLEFLCEVLTGFGGYKL